MQNFCTTNFRKLSTKVTKNFNLKISQILKHNFAKLWLSAQAEHGDIFEVYLKAERKGRTCTIWLSSFIVGSCTMTLYLLSLIHSWVSMWNGNYETSTWFVPYKLVVPFDTSSIFGWYMLWLIQIYAGYTYVLSISAVISYFVSCCFYIEACCEHLFLVLKALNTDLLNDVNGKNRLHHVIIFHIEVMKLVMRCIWHSISYN